MVLTLTEYADSLDDRKLIWPQVPAPVPLKSRPSIKRLPGIRAVLWDIYGTLLRTPDDSFTLFPEPEIRLQVALDKTIHEFNMWNHMYRKPGPPWQSMIHQYRDYIDRATMVAPKHRGDFTEINLVAIWRSIVARLFDKEFVYDTDTLGDEAQLSEKVAYFFHSSLQALEGRANAGSLMTQLREAGIQQGALADGQQFTLLQVARKTLTDDHPPLRTLLSPSLNTLSSQYGVRKPSKSLFDIAIERLDESGISPEDTLHVSSRLTDSLVPAKAAGMKTALLAVEKTGLEADPQFIKDPQTRPDRLLTDLSQITEVILG